MTIHSANRVISNPWPKSPNITENKNGNVMMAKGAENIENSIHKASLLLICYSMHILATLSLNVIRHTHTHIIYIYTHSHTHTHTHT